MFHGVTSDTLGRAAAVLGIAEADRLTAAALGELRTDRRGLVAASACRAWEPSGDDDRDPRSTASSCTSTDSPAGCGWWDDRDRG